jgi:3-phosphoshikimate 1-carboxyvinyltransferase
MTLVLAAPGSKSQTQRALVLAALTDSPTTIAGGLDCDDSRRLRTALRSMGTTIDESPARGERTANDWLVSPDALRTPDSPIHCGNAGTTLRFCAAFSLLLEGPLTLDGDEHMRRRPIDDLAAALGTLGVDVRWDGTTGRPPLTLRRVRPAGVEVEVAAERSSQFASALLLVAPQLPAGLVVRLRGAAVSLPYLDLTVQALRAFGASVDVDGGAFRVAPGPLHGGRFEVEGDWSSAAFLLAAGRIAGRAVRVANVRDDSSQGDRAVVGMLARLDGRGPRIFDLADCPDLIAPLAAAAAFADGATEIRRVAHARIKESDRVRVLADGLRAAGCRVDELPDGLRVERGTPAGGTVTLDPHDDHRMAMAFGLLSLRLPGLRVANPGCVSKSYPGFWDDLERFR